MRIFTCDCNPSAGLFFESVQCTLCQRLVGFCPDRFDMLAFEPTGQLGCWYHAASGTHYRQCRNYSDSQVCNWMIPAGDPEDLCRACRLNAVIPDLSRPRNLQYWRKLETAKRRALYTTLELGLPLASQREDPARGLAFRFMADREPGSEFTEPLHGQRAVFTGHIDGVITVNLAEADDIARTRARVELGEAYRTLLGHMRHEIGHYYWYRLVTGSSANLALFRSVFGDERENYQAALQRHYEQGPRPDWPTYFVSSYAAMHPWEDWAECWAHYLHMLDTLETAQTLQLRLGESRIPASSLPLSGKRIGAGAIADYLHDWMQLSIALNALNRSMGMPDAYPFVLNDSIQRKLACVHQLVTQP